MMLTVRRLTAADDAWLDTITMWMYGWWGEKEGYSRDAVACCMAHSLNEVRLPQTFGLFDGERLIGMYQFTLSDMFHRPDVYP